MARKFLTPIDLSQLELQNARVQNLASAPGSPVEGQIYHDTVAHRVYYYNGTGWIAADGSSIVFGTIPAVTEGIGQAAVLGTSTGAAHADHVHPMAAAAAPAASAVGDTVVTGSASTFAGSDHKHAREAFAAPTAQTAFGASSVTGSATTLVHSDHTHGTPTHIGSDHSAISISSLAVPTGDVAWGTNKITGVKDPTGPQDAATKNYVDGVATGLDVKASVRAASTTNVTGTYNATGGTSGRGQFTAMPNTVDGVSLAGNDRVFLKDQAASGGGAANGIWVVTTLGTGANGVWDRATDFDQDAEVTAGAFTFVEAGTVNADTGWVLTTDNPITIGGASGTVLTFVQFSSAGLILGGAGLLKTGTTIDAVAGTTPATSAGPGGGLKMNADDMVIDATIVARKYNATVGDGAATSYVITHSLSNQWCTVQVFLNSGTFAQVDCDIELTSTSTATLRFATAPASAACRVVITG
jgi:hypothetical protein